MTEHTMHENMIRLQRLEQNSSFGPSPMKGVGLSLLVHGCSMGDGSQCGGGLAGQCRPSQESLPRWHEGLAKVKLLRE